MRRLAAVAIASTFVAGLAAAQMKVPAKQQPQTSTSPVQILMNKQQQPPAAAAADPALESARRIPREEAIRLVKENKAIFVDVRTKESYAAEHIKGALSFPLSDLPARMGELPKNKLIITYCA